MKNDSHRVMCVILGGGRGSRLYPLTKSRAKPAVPLLGQYRLIDVPISNCLNSGFKHIYVLTQFNSKSLLRHIANTYKFDIFSEGWVQVMPAQQTLSDANWYQGTADAVRQNLSFITSREPEYTIILSGDQLYRMDFNQLIRSHRASKADVTVCCKQVPAGQCSKFGILKRDSRDRVLDFVEKPDPNSLPDDFIDARAQEIEKKIQQNRYLASIGIYIFNTNVLVQALQEKEGSHDFGSEILPYCASTFEINTDVFEDYWQDIGTIRSFYQFNISFVKGNTGFELYGNNAPIYTHPRFLPLPAIKNCSIHNSIIGSGSEIRGRDISNSVIGLRTQVGENVRIKRSVIMGADYTQKGSSGENDSLSPTPSLGVGSDSTLEGCIIDKNVCIGEGVKIRYMPGRPDEDNELYSVRDGIVVIPKNTVVEDGTVI